MTVNMAHIRSFRPAIRGGTLVVLGDGSRYLAEGDYADFLDYINGACQEGEGAIYEVGT